MRVAEQRKTDISLGSVISINPSSIGKDYPYDEIQYIDISSVGNGILLGTSHYNICNAPSRAKRLVAKGDTILSTVRPNRRSFLFIKNPIENLVVSTGFAVLRASEKIDSRFLYYTVTNQFFTDYLAVNAKGAAYPAVDTDTIARARINLPDVSTQRKIASILSAYDDLIENNNRRIKILEGMAQTIYREWFVNFRFPGHEKVGMVKSELGMIPEGWEVSKIGEVIETLGGGTPSTKNHEYWMGGDIIWYTPSDITKNDQILIHEAEKKITTLGLKKSSARMFPAYCVMLTSRATIGEIAINTKPACTNQGFITCIPNEKLNVYYLYFWLKEMKNKIIALAGGATYKEINRTTFRNLLIMVPNKSLMLELAVVLKPMLNQLENLLLKINILRKTRDRLLPKLISGEITVEKLDIAVIENE